MFLVFSRCEKRGFKHHTYNKTHVFQLFPPGAFVEVKRFLIKAIQLTTLQEVEVCHQKNLNNNNNKICPLRTEYYVNCKLSDRGCRPKT